MGEPPSVVPNTSDDPASLRSVFVFAQLSTSISDDQIRLIILALLAVAFLLAALTVWYFVRTSPRRRAQAAQARRAVSGQPRRVGAASARPTPDPSTGSTTVAGAAGHNGSPVGHDEDDEWTRLTAPEQQRPANG